MANVKICCDDNSHVFCSIDAITIYAVCLESFCALNSAGWKVLTFWASGLMLAFVLPDGRGAKEKGALPIGGHG